MGYTVEALQGTRENLAAHLKGDSSIEMIRTRTRRVFDGAARVTRRAGGAIHDWHVSHWPVTVADVLGEPATPDAYAEATRRWAEATLAAIVEAGQSD
jgi:hypothetical protein